MWLNEFTSCRPAVGKQTEGQGKMRDPDRLDIGYYALFEPLTELLPWLHVSIESHFALF